MRLTAEIKRNDLSYPVIVERGALYRLREFLPVRGRVMILTGSGVPSEYVSIAAAQLPDAAKVTAEDGESAKGFEAYSYVLHQLLENHFDRSDTLIALGGGTIGDLAGFAASTYKRGIELIHIPTTTLSQLDSCVGGKTALNLSGVKNAVGTIYQPSAVVIDPELAKTLPKRHFYNGMAEALKAGVIRDVGLFGLLERVGQTGAYSEEVIARALSVKLDVIREDETDTGIRKLLNFGHTIGHALESVLMGKLLHGECVLWGMIPMLEKKHDRERLFKLIKEWGIPSPGAVDPEKVFEFILSDKKVSGETITISTADRIGHAVLKSIPIREFRQHIDICIDYWRTDR